MDKLNLRERSERCTELVKNKSVKMMQQNKGLWGEKLRNAIKQMRECVKGEDPALNWWSMQGVACVITLED